MLNCARCGLTNRPYDAACAICSEPLQDQAAADARRKEWDALGPRLRAEQEAVFDRMRTSRLEHREWLKKHRRTHAIAGALLLNFIMACATLFKAPWCIPVDLALGAGAGLLVNHLRGGGARSAGVFFGAAAFGILFKIPFFEGAFGQGYWLLAVFGLLAVYIVGYVMGIKLDDDHADRSVTT